MKKIYLSLLAFFSVFLLVSCGVFVDDVKSHNGLVQKLNVILDSEEAFYNQYIDLAEGDDSAKVKKVYENFKLAIDDLDSYIKNTDFASSQHEFTEAYDDFYYNYLNDYIVLAGEFIKTLESAGVIFDVIDQYRDKLDRFSLDFVDIHNRYVKVVNSQSDDN